MQDLIPVILSGGSGTRLWPLSRESHPKQFLPLVGDDTLLQATWKRVRGLSACRPIVVGRRCAEARGEYNPRTGSGTASHCTRWEPITQTLCERQCTSGGVYYWR